jgi:DNA-binding transcriptional LysR family regulator
VTLTEEGQRFHAQVAPLLSELADAADNVAGASLAVRGRVRVNVDPWLARLVLAPRLEAFMARYPELPHGAQPVPPHGLPAIRR